MSSSSGESSHSGAGPNEKSGAHKKSFWRHKTTTLSPAPSQDLGEAELGRRGSPTNVSFRSERNSMIEQQEVPAAAAPPVSNRGVLHFLVSRLWSRDKEARSLIFPQGSESSSSGDISSTVAREGREESKLTEQSIKSVYLTNLNPKDYEQYLKLGLTLKFAHHDDEAKFSDKLRGSYRYIAPMIGTFYTICTVCLNFLVGVIVVRENSIRLLCAWICNLIINIILCLYLIRFGRASFQWTTRKAEVTCLICLLINPVMISITSVVYRAEIAGDFGAAYSRDIDFWILEWSSICISLAFIDLWQISRTKNTIYAHILLTALVFLCRVYWLRTIPHSDDPEDAALELVRSELAEVVRKEAIVGPFGAPRDNVQVYTAVFQSLVLTSIIWQMYCSRYLEELRERLLFIANRCNLTILSKLREAEKAERKFMELRNEGGLSFSERITQPLKRAMLEILNLAFKEEESGDLYLLELNEQLRSCIILISANAEQLFEIKHACAVSPDNPLGKKEILSQQELIFPATNTIAGSILVRGATVQNQFLGDQLGAGGPPDLDTITSPSYLRNVGKELDLGCIKLFQERKNFLLETAFHVMKDMQSTGKIDHPILLRYIFLIQQRHWDNPYHNRGHVAMVVHMTKLFCDAFKLAEDDLLAFASLLAALSHDVAHGGRNSQFIITDGIERNNNLLVDLCGTSNVVEGLHAHLGFRLAQIQGCNIFQKLTESQYRLLRQYVIDLILATNMASHFEILGALRLRHQSGAADWFNNVEDQMLLRKIVIKAADLAHVCVAWSEHFEWSTRIVNEFYQQGDLEIALKYPISPLCDRQTVDQWAASQLEYVTEVVMPLFSQLSLLPHQKVFADALLVISINQDQWKKPQTFKQLNEQNAPYKYEDALLYASLLAPSTLLDKEPQLAPAFIALQGTVKDSTALPVAKVITNESDLSESSLSESEQEQQDSSREGEQDSSDEDDDAAVSDNASYSGHGESSEESSSGGTNLEKSSSSDS